MQEEITEEFGPGIGNQFSGRSPALPVYPKNFK
jgi:hypothetical protein